jgi:hypothetical protein
MRNLKRAIHRLALAPVLALVVAATTGCPVIPIVDDALYDAGFNEGFLLDEWFWEGYFDGYDTLEGEPILYEGGDIPFFDTPPYDAGFWDGVWYAYNDGYFVDYRYAFIIGFSEGYDSAFYDDYLDFLAGDMHIELLDGGWSDAYNDGFSEGRVFGANDFEQGLDFDWLDAFLDYEAGTDLFFDEVGVGTGASGPVIYYEYGTDPNLLKGLQPSRERANRRTPTLRKSATEKGVDVEQLELYRPLNQDAVDSLDFLPTTTDRGGVDLRLTTTWLERIDAYHAAIGLKAATKQVRARTAESPESK